MTDARPDIHSKLLGYLLWIFGFTGAHRFYFGRPVTGTLWFFTPGAIGYNVAWVLLTFLGIFGVHRFYMGKWLTGLLYLVTGGVLLVGVLYDVWTLNSQIREENRARGGR